MVIPLKDAEFQRVNFFLSREFQLPTFPFMNIINLAKLFSITIILFIFAFLINNYLTFGGNWPGALSFNKDINIYSTIQISLYFLSLFFPILLIYYYKKNLTLNTIANYLQNTNSFIIRSAFWAVFIIGIVDAIISLLILSLIHI